MRGNRTPDGPTLVRIERATEFFEDEPILPSDWYPDERPDVPWPETGS